MNSNNGGNVQLRSLAETDLFLLHQWLNTPHLKPFYMQAPISANSVRKKFTPRIKGDDPCRCLIAYQGEKPFGYIQWYLNRNFPEYGAAVIGEKNGVSFDYFVGSIDHLGQGLGSAMLRNLALLVSKQVDAADRIIFVGHQLKNTKAINCSKRAGFVYRRDFVEGGIASALYVHRSQLDDA